MNEVNGLIVQENITIKMALEQINDGCQGILLLVNDKGQLLRTITDGDIRRILLKEMGFDLPLSVLPDKKPVTATVGMKHSELADLMQVHRINQIPVVDSNDHPIAVVHLNDIDSPILLSTPHMGNEEQIYVADAFNSNWIAPVGPNVDAFETELAHKVGIEHAAALSSGTAAIHLSLILLGVDRGDRVYCSTLTFASSVNPIIYQGGVPVFIDSDYTTWNMSPQALRRALEHDHQEGQLPKAVIIVNLYGQSADMDPLVSLCDQFDIPVIEDAAESLGARYHGKASGTFGRLGIYSFNGNKIITTSAGGVLVSDDGEMIEKAKFLSTQARDPAPYYLHTQIGYNYRMSNVLAGIGRGQLSVLEERVEARRCVFERYVEGLRETDVIKWMPELEGSYSNRWLTCFTLRSKCENEIPEIIQAVSGYKIECRQIWYPMHCQPVFSEYEYYSHEPGLSVSDEIFQYGMCLPSGSNLTGSQQDRVIEALSASIRQVCGD